MKTILIYIKSIFSDYIEHFCLLDKVENWHLYNTDNKTTSAGPILST